MERDPKLSNAQRSVDDAVKAYALQACGVLDEFALVVSSMDEIEALLELLRGAEPPYRLLSVVIKGPVPQENVVDPLVAQMRAALEGEGFTLQRGNLYNLPYYDLPQDFLQAAEQPAD
ncbi:uncharacterized protein LOC125315087 [Rhodamnia argentea]|uniref:Uncharacterized protein LOC125315087 n=1 Tax=Rhodamnia argentea TaxID=178133 RepID=A0ABM3HEK0_9MYRT|nr:uncharacterized protein LOC125315087 [Rhodamnia argentea]